MGCQVTGDRVIPSDAILRGELAQLLAEGMSRSQASRHLAELTQMPRRHLYQLTLDLSD